MAYPQINLDELKKRITGSRWDLDASWLKAGGIKSIPGRYISSDSSEIDISDLWEYIQSSGEFVEPECLSLVNGPVIIPPKDGNPRAQRLTRSNAPIFQMIPHMTALIALKLYWFRDEHREQLVDPPTSKIPPVENQLNACMGILTSAQLNQLQHLSLYLTNCHSTTAELSGWLSQMSQLQSLTLHDLAQNKWDNGALKIPSFPNLRQLHFGMGIQKHQLELGVQPALTRLMVVYFDSTQVSHWLPNIAEMTSLESLTMSNLLPVEMVEVSAYLPTRLEHLVISTGPQYELDESECKTVWTNLMRLSQLTDLETFQLEVPEFFVNWMKTSKLSTMPIILNMQSKLAPLLAQTLPEMTQLNNISVVPVSLQPLSPTQHRSNWIAPTIRECTRLMHLWLFIPVQDIPFFIPALERLENLVELQLHCYPPAYLTIAFYDLNFPHLTRFDSNMVVAKPRVTVFGEWLARHPQLTQLFIGFLDNEALEACWNVLAQCTALTKLTLSMNTAPSSRLPKLPPGLQRLNSLFMEGQIDPSFVPDDHMLSHIQDEPFANNVRRHQTLLDSCYPDYLDFFWTKIARK